MRREAEVIKQILDFAEEENRVRAVMLNGSRLNPNAVKDIMQDYDIVFFIENIQDNSYKTNRDWIKRFGELVILQQNDFDDGSYIFLMQFKDGVRIDLSFRNIIKIKGISMEDSLSKILLNKDGLAPKLTPPNDSSYFVKRPDQKEFDKLMNEVWWIQTYVAKAIWRDEMPLAKYMFDVILIDCIRKLLSYYIGLNYNWNINVGKCGKWFKRYLPEDIYNELIALYPAANYEEMWQSLFLCGEFIRNIGRYVSEKLGYNYPDKDDANVTDFIKRIKMMPENAEDFS